MQELIINKCSCLFNASQSLAIKIVPLGSAYVETSPEDTLFLEIKKLWHLIVSYVHHIIILHPGNIKLKLKSGHHCIPAVINGALKI